MIELKDDRLIFSFPEVHPQARLTISFQRTLRIPDDNRDYPLPPGLGNFPLRHVDDFSKTVPATWLEHGGIMLPMYQSEALWADFRARYIDNQGTYPFAVKIATGKINAITGGSWDNNLQTDPQDYMVAPEQPWLDGYCVEEGIIRQFVAMPLGSGYSAEEQLTGTAEHGGLQIIVCPMKREVFERLFPVIKQKSAGRVCESASEYAGIPLFQLVIKQDMSLAPGGRMKQEIYDDPYGLDVWETDTRSRCFVHIANSLAWRSITSTDPPTVPLTAKEYKKYDLPWFEYYSDGSKSLGGSKVLKGLKSIMQKAKEKNDNPLPENDSVEPQQINKIHGKRKKDQVREGHF